MALIYLYDQLHPQVQCLLETLLQRVEMPERRRKVRVRLNAQTHRWYFERENPGLRRRVHEELVWLAQQGWLVLRWQKYEVGNELEAVEFVAEEKGTLTSLYAFCRRESRQQQEERLRQLLMTQQPAAAWIQAFLQDTLVHLASFRSPAPLSLSTPKTNGDLLVTLNAIARLNTPTLERTLSVRLFGDSKRLEALRPSILSVLRTYSPHYSATMHDEWELLRAHFLHRPPIFTSMVGPLILSIPPQAEGDAHNILNLGVCPTGLGLPDDILRTAQMQSRSLQAVLTIENQTSYTDMLLIRPHTLLLIFCNGFPQAALVSFLQRLRDAYPAMPFWHWGDLDAGGLEILLHLRRQLGPIQPCAMGPQTFERYSVATRPLAAGDAEHLNSFLSEPLLIDCEPVIRCLLKTHHKLEQEAIEREYVLEQLTLSADTA